MKNFIDDTMVEAATDAYLKSTPTHGQSVKFKDMRAALKATLPLIGEKLARSIVTYPFGSRYALTVAGAAAFEADQKQNKRVAARIRELTGAKP